MLDEVRSPLGVLLWQAVRDVGTWAATPAESHSRLFDSEAYRRRLADLSSAGPHDELRTHLVVLSRVLLGQEDPGREEVAKAARSVASWAEEHGLPQTAIWFAQAAALALPEQAEYAHAVGVLARRHADYPRAETWLRRAIGLARRRRDVRVYVLSYLSLGTLFIQRDGNYARAREAFERAYRLARRAGIRPLRAQALHELFVVAGETNQIAEAELLAQKAGRAYDPWHPQLPSLANDVAVFWLLQGAYARALPVFEAVSRVVTSPSVRLFVLSNLARAAGGAGRLDVFAQAWVDTWQLIDERPTLECVTSSLLRLAYGSAYLGDRERVDLAGRLAVRLATERGEDLVRKEAEELLAAVENDRSPGSQSSPTDGTAVSESADRLAEQLVRKLAVCAGSSDHPRTHC